jgi:hypothetical protein
LHIPASSRRRHDQAGAIAIPNLFTVVHGRASVKQENVMTLSANVKEKPWQENMLQNRYFFLA